MRVARLLAPLLEQISSRTRALPMLLAARASLQDFSQTLLPALGGALARRAIPLRSIDSCAETSEAIAQRQRLQRQLLAPFIPHQLHFPALDRALVADELDGLKAVRPPLLVCMLTVCRSHSTGSTW